MILDVFAECWGVPHVAVMARYVDLGTLHGGEVVKSALLYVAAVAEERCSRAD